MDWSRCDDIEYDCRFEGNNIMQSGNLNIQSTILTREA